MPSAINGDREMILIVPEEFLPSVFHVSLLPRFACLTSELQQELIPWSASDCNRRHPSLFSLSVFFFFLAVPLHIALTVVSRRRGRGSCGRGPSFAVLKVGVALAPACLCGHVTTCRPLVWLSAAQQSISRPKQRIHNARAASECFSKCHRHHAKTHLSPVCTSRASVVFAGGFSCAPANVMFGFFWFVFSFFTGSVSAILTC